MNIYSFCFIFFCLFLLSSTATATFLNNNGKVIKLRNYNKGKRSGSIENIKRNSLVEHLSLNEKNNILYLSATDQSVGNKFKEIHFISIKDDSILSQNYKAKNVLGLLISMFAFVMHYGEPRTFSDSIIRRYKIVKSGLVLNQSDYLLSTENPKVVLRCFENDLSKDTSIVVFDSMNGHYYPLVDSNRDSCQVLTDSVNRNLYQCCWAYESNYASTTCSAINIPK
ncbi:hypothetical protein ABK040_011515 [Willaertia magna]